MWGSFWDQPATLIVGPLPSGGEAHFFERLDDGVRHAVENLTPYEQCGSHLRLDDGEEILWPEIERLYAELQPQATGAAAPSRHPAPQSERPRRKTEPVGNLDYWRRDEHRRRRRKPPPRD